FKTWFEPLRAVNLEHEGDLVKLTVQLPSRFYYEWLEEHYFGLLRKTITKVLGPQGRLFYDIVIEKDDAERGYEGTSMHLPARQPANEPPARPASPSAPAAAAPPGGRPSPERGTPPAFPPGRPAAPAPAAIGPSGAPTVPVANPFVIPGIKKAQIDSQLNASYTFERFIEGDCNR